MKVSLTLIAVLGALTACGAEPIIADPTGQDGAETAAAAEPAARLDTQGDRWILAPDPANWQDAVNGAPEGYRLPHRWELIKAFDGGELERVNAAVWTATDRDEWEAWRVLFTNMPGYYESKSYLVDKRTSEYVIYVRGE